MKSNRTAWEREGYFDDLYANGAVAVPRHKWVYLADQWNICPTVKKVWLQHWRDYIDDQKAKLRVVIAGTMVFLWQRDRQEENTTLTGDE